MSTPLLPVNALDELAQQAAQRWIDLRSLSANEAPGEAELRAAGVSERRISLLLVPRFDDLAVALSQLTKQVDFNPPGTSRAWEVTAEMSRSLFWQCFGNERQAEFEAFCTSITGRELRDSIFTNLSGDMRFPRAGTMIESLWRMHGLMALPQHASKELVQRCFLEAVSWVPLPKSAPELR